MFLRRFFKCMWTGTKPKPGDCQCIFYCADEESILFKYNFFNKLK
jgi:hypothetical protein